MDKNNLPRPSKIIMMRSGNEVGHVELTFTSDGRLSREVYYSGNKMSGSSEYNYAGHLLSVTHKDENGKVHSVMSYSYSGECLQKIQVRGKGLNRTMELECKGDRTSQARIIEGGGNELDSFKVSWGRNGMDKIRYFVPGEASAQQIIAFRYGSDGRLMERLRSQGNQVKKSRILYSGNKINRVQFFTTSGSLEKELVYSYN